ncbi:adenylyl-sulfate kinase [Candidatus Nomurabacteria bacterium]|nr:adenylyl-sulfate kinase [Candidatus Nomurabacteria bacterium]
MKEILESKKELVRLTTAGSVDDGKSTLIGRLLFDCDAVYQDQLESIKKSNDGEIDFALITDGLSSEREQGITIDVAYRYFSTRNRRFIISDVPGHEQYTKNMVTGASNADIAIILIDARRGVMRQSRRHLCIASLLQIPHVLVLVNKMDAIDYDRKAFEDIQSELSEFAAKLSIKDLQFIPISALKGDFVTKKSDNMSWYQGRTLLDYLENVQINVDRNLIDFRFPVQYVLRPHQDFRGYAGVVEGGAIKTGETVMVLPSKKISKIKEIYVGDRVVNECFSPQSALLTLEDEIDIARGDMLVRPNNVPQSKSAFEAYLCWMGDEKMELGHRYLVKQTTNMASSRVTELNYRLNVETLHRETAECFELNDIGKVVIRTQKPLYFDPYKQNRNTGGFILIDEATNQTVAAGMIIAAINEDDAEDSDFRDVSMRVQKPAPVLWFEGLSGSGKSTLADAVYERLVQKGIECRRLDGDLLREHITGDLGFGKEGRAKNLEIAGYLAQMLSQHGVVVLSTFITPYESVRRRLREQIENFQEIYVSTSLEVCEQRDVKGLYQKARKGEIENFTGISDDFEVPKNPALVIDTHNQNLEDCAQQIVKHFSL